MNELKEYLEHNNLNFLTSEQLEQNPTNSNKTKYWPWILGGIALVIVIGLIVYFWIKKDKEPEPKY